MEQDNKFILGCINSCLNQWQLECCERLIELFVIKHGEGKEHELLSALIQRTALVVMY